MNNNAVSSVIVLPHIKVQNANGFSSPFTLGFPAVTAWLGAVHKIQREIRTAELNIQFSGVGIISHDFELQAYKGPGDFVHSIIGTGNPLEPKTEKGKPKGHAVRPSFIEEPRCHLDVSLVVGFSGIEAHQESGLVEKIAQVLAAKMKIAGGDILTFKPPRIVRNKHDLPKHIKAGYALVERRDLLQQAMANGQDAMDGILHYLAVHHACEKTEVNSEAQIQWQSFRQATDENDKHGWIVPIATGFQGISERGRALNQRNPDVDHCFAETVVTLGEFIMHYRLNEWSDFLWRYEYDSENALYLCRQQLIEQDECDY